MLKIREFIMHHILRNVKSICWCWSVLWGMGYNRIGVTKRSSKCGYCGNCMTRKDMARYEELMYEEARIHRLLWD